MTSSRFLSAAEVQDGCVAWQAPEVREEPRVAPDNAIDPEALAAEAMRRAFEQGLEEGRAAGLAAGQREMDETRVALERVLHALARPLEELDVRVEEELVALVRAICQKLVHRELKLDPTHVVGIIREGLAALPAAAGAPVIRLHPDDAKVVQTCLAAERGTPWQIEPDPVIEPGNCMMMAGDSQIDGRLETRLGRVITAMLGGDRADDE